MTWLFKKKRDADEAHNQEVSLGGSRVVRHTRKESFEPQFGMLGEETIGYGKRREQVYEEFFGTIDRVFHEVLPLVPHIDVYQFKLGYNGRNFYTLATGGMSDLLMTLPADVSHLYGRVELIFYCDQPKDEYMKLLHFLARFPHDNKTWLGFGHTMPNGNPPSPIFEHNPYLDTFLFIGTIVSPDNGLAERLVLDSTPVNFLWVVPITSRECELKLQKGVDAIYDLFDSVKHPHVFTGDRSSYI